jgi:hypothetical protein
MINRFFTILLTVVFSTLSFISYSQVKKVSYQLLFNETTALYECYLNIDEGSARTSAERVQFNSQVSIVMPTGSEISVVENFMPLENNINGKSTKPQRWNVSNRINNELSGYDYVGLNPRLSPSSFYNDLNAGDKVKLFTFKVSPLPKCGEGVRLFDNNLDPSSTKSSMNGGDFRHGFTIGGVSQKYAGNLEMINTALPSGTVTVAGDAFESKNIQLIAGEWSKAENYTWTGPNGFYSNQSNPVINNLTLNHSGEYKLTVRSTDGCTNTKTIHVNVLPINSFSTLEGEDHNTGSFSKTISSSNLDIEVSTRLFPNPATNFINLTVNAMKGANVKSSIYDIDGKVVLNNVLNQSMESDNMEKTIPLKLKAGIYTVITTIDGVDFTDKFLYVE